MTSSIISSNIEVVTSPRPIRIYLIGSLRNPEVPDLGNWLREQTGFEIFDDWYAGSEDADDWWCAYEKARGHTYQEAIYGHAADHVFDFDQKHINASAMGVLLMPAGKSGHLELGYMAGQGKPTFILTSPDPERWEVMARFASRVVFSRDELLHWIGIHANLLGRPLQPQG